MDERGKKKSNTKVWINVKKKGLLLLLIKVETRCIGKEKKRNYNQEKRKRKT